MHLYVFVFVSISTYVSICVSIYVSIFISLSLCLSLYLSFSLSLSLFLSPSLSLLLLSVMYRTEMNTNTLRAYGLGQTHVPVRLIGCLGSKGRSCIVGNARVYIRRGG